MVHAVEVEARKRPWSQEVAAGLSVATVSIPAALASGVLTFSAVGPSFLLAGAVFGLMAGALSALLSGLAFRAGPVAGPVSTVCVTQAILISSLAAHPSLAGDPGRIVALMTVSVLLTGLVQLALAMLRVGSIIEFAPYPVIAGFLNGVALLTIGSQVLLVLHESSWSEVLSRPPSRMDEWAPLAFLAVFVAIGLAVPRLVPRLPAAAVNFALGLLLYYAAIAVVPEAWLGPRLTISAGTLEATLTSPAEMLAAFAGLRDLPELLIGQVAFGALTVAAIGIIELSMSARLLENASHRRLDKYGLLTWLGLTNILASPMGVPSSGSMSQTAARWRSGGLGRVSDLVRAASMVGIATLGMDLLHHVPIIVVAGQLVLVGIGIFDVWSTRQVIRMLRSRHATSRAVAVRSIAVIAIVMVATASGHIVLGAALGVAAACWMFIADSVNPLIRSRLRSDTARSRKVRPLRDLAVLNGHPDEAVILVLQGPVFFGNAVELGREIDRLGERTRAVIFDLRRVTSVDVSAIATIGAIARRAGRSSRAVALCGLPDSLAFMGEELSSDPTLGLLLFHDRDAALEWSEDRLLVDWASDAGDDDALTLDRVDVTSGFTPGQLERFTARLTLLSYGRGDVLCREGDDGDTVWILVQGSVSIWIAVGDRPIGFRVGGFAAGTTVGEIGFLQGTRRTASVVANGPLTCFGLSRAAFDALSRDDPALAMLFFKNVATVLAARLSTTTDHVRWGEMS